jgi:NAD(P)-dependent dehydrogenase (short-subunit alcohol dehydrogenase family)
VSTPDGSSVPDFPGLLRLDGRRVVLLGGGQGIGRQAAHALTSCGASVLCVDVDAQRADAVAGETGAVAWVGDATVRSEVDRLLVDASTSLGGIDGVVDVIGMARYADLPDINDELWAWHFDIVLRHAQLVTQVLVPAIAEAGGGSVALVASVSGFTAAPRHAAYGAAKAGLMSLVRSAAVEFGPRRVRVNAVAPGTVWTPRVAGLLGPEGKLVQEAQAPLRRVATPADIAAVLLFLTSDLAAHVTGQTLVVDGGSSVRFPFDMSL